MSIPQPHTHKTIDGRKVVNFFDGRGLVVADDDDLDARDLVAAAAAAAVAKRNEILSAPCCRC